VKANRGAALRSSQNGMPEEWQIGPCPQRRTELSAQIGYVNVDSGMDVVKQIPADMVGVFVNDEIIATIPAPVGGQGPIPVGDLKVEAAREPEAVVFVVNPSDAVAIGRTEMFETAMREWVVDVKTLVVRSVMPVPMIVAHMWRAIHRAILPMLLFPPEVLGIGFRRRGRDTTLIGARRILMVLLVRLMRLSCRLGDQNGVRATS
jgi:hypothetical protein